MSANVYTLVKFECNTCRYFAAHILFDVINIITWISRLSGGEGKN